MIIYGDFFINGPYLNYEIPTTQMFRKVIK